METYFFSKEAQTLSGLTAEQLKEALQDEAGSLKEDAGSQFNTLVLKKFKATEDEAFNKGFRKKAATIEKAAKSVLDHFGIQSATIEDAMAELAERVKDDPGKPGPELTIEQLRKLPMFQQEIDDRLTKIKAEKEKTETEYKQYKDSVTRQKIESAALNRALNFLSEKKAAFAPQPGEQIKRVLSASGMQNVHLDEKGDLIMLDTDGQPLRDTNANRVTFDDFVLNSWTALGLGFNEAPGGSGSPGAGGAGAGSGAELKITSFEQYQAARKAAGTDMKKMSEIAQAWAKHQAG